MAKALDLHRLVETVADEAAKAIAVLSRRIAELEKAQADTLRFKGVWSSSGIYTRGDLVLHGGQVWHANAATGTSKPGTDTHWQLLGKDQGR